MTPRLPPVRRFREIYRQQVSEARSERVARERKARAERGVPETVFWGSLAVTLGLAAARDDRDGTVWDGASGAAALVTLGALLVWITVSVRRPLPVAVAAVAVAAVVTWLDAGDGGWDTVSWPTVAVIALVPAAVTAYRRARPS